MQRTFTWEDQHRFAELSGDYNPIHVDAVAARRLLFGRPVVHGIHVLLWALDGWLREHGGPVRLSRLKVGFRGPVFLDAPLELVVKPAGSGMVKLDVVAQGAGLMTARVVWHNGMGRATGTDSGIPERVPCRAWSAADVRSARGELATHLNPARAAQLFPAALRHIPNEQVAALLAATRMVGMEAPGEHSVFTGLDLEGTEEDSEPGCLSYAVEDYDDRFSLLTIRVKTPGFQGTVSAALRPSPVEQASFAGIARHVAEREFQGERALVIGGSRGLGEVAVKALAAGGAEVKFTYLRGVQEAERIVAEVAGGGRAVACFAYNGVTDGCKLGELLGDWAPTLLCYFATPFAFSSVQGRFSRALYRQFSEVYIDGFLETFEALQKAGNSLRNVLYPSSVALDELPANMGEYAVAKAAVETLCRFLGKTHKRVLFHSPRLERLATDQTVSLLQVDNAEPWKVVLRLLREVYAQRGEEGKNR